MADLPYISGGGTQIVVPVEQAVQLVFDAKEDKNKKGGANGYAPLDGNAKVPAANLPDQASLDAEVDGKITTHNSATTSVHGIANTANLVLTDDLRLADNRTPTAHKSSHSTGGTDALTPSDIGASPTSHLHSIGDVINLQSNLNDKTQVFTAATLSGFPATGNARHIYIETNTETFYRWNGSTLKYVETSSRGRLLNPLISINNPAFSDVTGLTQRTAPDQLQWYDGAPVGWTSPPPVYSPRQFNVLAYNEGFGFDFAANLETLSVYDPALGGVSSQPLSTGCRQTIGPFTSDATGLTIGYRWLELSSPAGFAADSTLGVAIYKGASLIAHQTQTSAGYYGISCPVTAGESLTIAFWAVLGTPLLAEVQIENYQNKTWLFPTNLATSASGLVAGEIYKDTNGFLKIV